MAMQDFLKMFPKAENPKVLTYIYLKIKRHLPYKKLSRSEMSDFF